MPARPIRAADLSVPSNGHLICGKWRAANSGETITAFDPSTGKAIGTAPSGDRHDIDRAVQAARAAFDKQSWSGLSPSARARILWRVADIVERDAERIAATDTLNMGMPFLHAMATVASAAESLRYYAGWITKIHGMTSEISAGQDFHTYSLKEPVGVVGLIVPWNAPFLMATYKVAQALAAGCTFVLKPAEETPFSALILGEILLEAGVPEGVANIVTGYGHTAGAALVAHDGVDKVSFTGSTEVGKKIVREAGVGNLKKVTLELGGKSPVIVLPDADLAQAIPGVAAGIYSNAGQVCCAGTRAFVHKSIYDDVMRGVCDIARNKKLLDGFDPACEMGPLVSAKQLERVSHIVGTCE
jgi:phenylacetaldehyde dehydrogenase